MCSNIESAMLPLITSTVRCFTKYQKCNSLIKLVLAIFHKCPFNTSLFIGWKDNFRVILGSDQVEAGKPAPDL